MDQREAILRELNVYPLWVRKNQPVPSRLGGGEAETEIHTEAETHIETETQQPAPGVSRAIVALNPSSASTASSASWPELKQQVRDCTACRLRAGCTQTVFGVGDEKADWLLVGEGPGADEDAQGEPFVGQAGKLLDNMLAAIKLQRGKNVYIANIVKCRPPENRTPAPDEIAACLPYLERQIAHLQPKLIIALGKVASNALLGNVATIASLRSKTHSYAGIPLIVTYHPAYLLRSPSEKSKAWQDLCLAVRVMEELQ